MAFAPQQMNPPPAAAPAKAEGSGFFSKSLDWLKTMQGCATALASLAALGGGGAAIAANTGGSSSPPAAVGIPSNELGTWGGQVSQSNGLTSGFTLSLGQSGTPGGANPVGTFELQAVGCQGDAFLASVSGSTMVLRLDTVTDPSGTCARSAVADAALTAAGSLDFRIISADALQGSIQSPLSVGNLVR